VTRARGPSLCVRSYRKASPKRQSPTSDGDPRGAFNANGYVFNDRFVLVVGENSQWARRRKIKLADPVSEPWIIP